MNFIWYRQITIRFTRDKLFNKLKQQTFTNNLKLKYRNSHSKVIKCARDSYYFENINKAIRAIQSTLKAQKNESIYSQEYNNKKMNISSIWNTKNSH